MSTLPSWLTDPLWDHFDALLPIRGDPTHPWGCHRRRIGDRIVFDELLQVLWFGCFYEVADALLASTLRARRDEWNPPAPSPSYGGSPSTPTTASLVCYSTTSPSTTAAMRCRTDVAEGSSSVRRGADSSRKQRHAGTGPGPGVPPSSVTGTDR
ncbi:hypothetical protein [Pseudonocardia dioxanivorans]|uniref:hypothetical protein n=1 Tax=Pseudonocardia dioxanivorans TaxID=240495 RepID=UPI0018F887BD